MGSTIYNYKQYKGSKHDKYFLPHVVSLVGGELVEADALGVAHLVRVAAHGHHSGLRLLQGRHELLHQVEVTEVICAKLQLDAVGGFGVRAHHDTGVEDQEVQLGHASRTGGFELLSEGLDVCKRGEVQLFDFHLTRRRRNGCANVFLGLLTLLNTAGGQDNASALASELANSHLANSGVGASDDRNLSLRHI